MVDVYLSVSDIEGYLGVSYDTTESAKMEKFITIGEKAFENEVGIYKTRTVTDYLYSSRNGILLNYVPVGDLTSVKKSTGKKTNKEFTAVDSDYYSMSLTNDRLLLLENPYLGIVYEVVYTTGYAYASMPEEIKYLVFLYTMMSMFETTNINNEGLDVTKTIDVDVYKKVTKGNPYNGFGALKTMIEDRKKNLMQSGNLKVYTKWNGGY